jgi:hypothetical protein
MADRTNRSVTLRNTVRNRKFFVTVLTTILKLRINYVTQASKNIIITIIAVMSSTIKLSPEQDGYGPVSTGVLENDAGDILEASRVTWEDTFFDGEDDIIAVFDFDYALMEDFQVKVGWATMIGSLFLPPLIVGFLVSLQPCLLRRRVQWDVYSQHLCITRDGIRFVRDKRKTCCGCACTDAGKSSKTVPFDKITDCDIEEPGGNTCICIENVLASVIVDTASSGTTNENGVVRHELVIRGLREPYKFKKLVWAMKRYNGGNAMASSSAVVPATMMHRSSAHSNNTMAELLTEIRDELREQTKILKGDNLKDKLIA